METRYKIKAKIEHECCIVYDRCATLQFPNKFSQIPSNRTISGLHPCQIFPWIIFSNLQTIDALEEHQLTGDSKNIPRNAK